MGPGLASRVDVVPAVDVSLTMLDGLWFLSCFDMCGCGLQGGVGESSEYAPSCRMGSLVCDLFQIGAGCLALEQLRSHFLEVTGSQTVDRRPQYLPVSVLQGDQEDERWTHRRNQTFQRRAHSTRSVVQEPTLILLLRCAWQLLKAHTTPHRRREPPYPHTHTPPLPDSRKKLFIISNKKSLACTSTPPDIHRECLHKRQWGLPPKIDYSTKSPILGTLHLPQNRATEILTPCAMPG